MNTLQEILKTAVKDPQTFVDADALYSAKFKTDYIIPGSDLANCGYDADWIIAQELSIKDGITPCKDNASDSEVEMYWDLVVEYLPEAREVLNNGVDFVMLVNYKGEECGFATVKASTHVGTFISRHNHK